MHTSTSYLVPNGDTSNRIVCLTITTDVTFPGTTGSVSTRHSSSDEHDPPSLQQNPYTWKCGISVRFVASNLLIPNFFRSILGWTKVAVFSTLAAQAEVASTALCFSRKPYTSTVHTVHRAPILHQDVYQWYSAPAYKRCRLTGAYPRETTIGILKFWVTLCQKLLQIDGYMQRGILTESTALSV